MFEGPIGPLLARELVAMHEDDWGVLRDRITDHRHGKKGLIARCLACESHVFIQTRILNGKRLPLFAHYKGGNPACPWYHGKTIVPNHVRAAQYQGQQESPTHRLMCEKIAEIVHLDRRYIRHQIGQYLPPTQNDHGRFPDVFVEWEEIGSFAIEFQLSNTFQTEISQRCRHYEREKIPLLWVLYGLDPMREMPQNFRDVIRRHRNNAFVLDHSAAQASFEQQTLVLTCHLRNDDGFDPPTLVRFDQLKIPPSRLPFYEDRIVLPLLQRIEERRRPWLVALDAWNKCDTNNVSVQAALETLPSRPSDDFLTVRLVAAALSIVSAAKGEERNFATKQLNISGMLNSLLDSRAIAPYATQLTRLIEVTEAHHLLKGTVGEHLRRAKDRAGDNQAKEGYPEWATLQHLIPEALDRVIHDQLAYFDALPHWVRRNSLPAFM